MKKIILLFVLGLSMFAVSCSQSTEDAFLSKVAGKKISFDNSTEIYEFSDDGKSFQSNLDSITYELISVDSSSRATYAGYIYNFTITILNNDVTVTYSFYGNSSDVGTMTGTLL